MKLPAIVFRVATPVLLAVIVLSCSGGPAESVRAYCERLDIAVDSVSRAKNISEVRVISRNTDAVLSGYANDETPLTEADRDAILESLIRYMDAGITALMATVSHDSPEYGNTAGKLAAEKRRYRERLQTILEDSSTLGEFVTKSREI